MMDLFTLGIVLAVLSLFSFYLSVNFQNRSGIVDGIMGSSLLFMIVAIGLAICSAILIITYNTKKETNLEYYLQFQDHNNEAEMFCYNEFLNLNKENIAVSFKDFNIKSCMEKLKDKDWQKEKAIIQKEIGQKSNNQENNK